MEKEQLEQLQKWLIEKAKKEGTFFNFLDSGFFDINYLLDDMENFIRQRGLDTDVLLNFNKLDIELLKEVSKTVEKFLEKHIVETIGKDIKKTFEKKYNRN